MDQLSYEERLRELGFLSLEKTPERTYCGLSLYKGGLSERRRDFSPRPVVTGQGAMVFNCERVDLDWI